MALSGTLDANFDRFVAEAQKAAGALKTIDAQGTTTASTVTKSFDSMTAGATTVTTATAKMGSASTNTFTTMAKELRVVDQSMAAFGVSISPVINVISEMGTVVGRTAASLSLLEKASVVLATAMAAWQFGRWIDEMLGLGAAVDEVVAAITGGLSPASEAFANRIETVRRAILAGGTEVKTFEEAVAFLQKKTADFTESLNTSEHRVATWTSEIQKAATSGALPQITADLESQNSTLQQLHKHYGISVEALQFLQRELANTAAATKEQAAADKKAADEAQAHADARQRLQDQMFGTDLIAKAQQYLAALGPIENLTRMSDTAQAALNTTLGQAIEAYTRMGTVAPQAMRDTYLATLQLVKVTTGLGAEWANVGEKVTIAAEGVIADSQRMQDATRAYEAETQRLVDEWQQVPPPVKATEQAVQQVTVAMQQLQSTATSTFERLQAGMALMNAYRAAGVATGMPIATGGYTFQQQRSGSVPTWASTGPSAPGPAWGHTLNVNVNNADAQGIASKLVTELRHSGVRF